MSDRQYTPGVSAPAPFSRAEEFEILKQTIEPFRSGLSSEDNPLGLFYLLDKTGCHNPVEALTRPYLMPTDAEIEKHRISSKIQTFGSFSFYAAAMYAGMMAAAHEQDYFVSNPHMERHLHQNMGAVGYGLLIMTSLQRHIAHEYTAHTNEPNIEELNDLLKGGYRLSTHGLMRMSVKDAVRTEREAGLFKWVIPRPDTPQGGSSITVEEANGKLGLSLTTSARIGENALCGAMHVNDDEGIPLARVIWDRVTKVGTQVDCLFPHILANASGV